MSGYVVNPIANLCLGGLRMPVWLTLLLGTAVTAAPQFISVLPAELQGVFTAIFAMGTSAYHLYQPAPLTSTKG